MGKLLSLCIPTNGVVEWLFPVLNSIYRQGVDEELYEVIITDNGDNIEFKQKIKEFVNKHNNIIYAETKALPFVNEIEAYKRASGEFIKFVNHRTQFVEGVLQLLLDYVKDNRQEKPITFFSNGALRIPKKRNEYDSFDEFVKNLSYFSSWSTGMAIWKTDFDRLSKDISSFNELFPHTDVLFNEQNRSKYIIDNTVIFDELPQGKRPKAHFDLYFATAVEYPSIILNLLRQNAITYDTFFSVKNDTLNFLCWQYYHYNIRKEYNSYDTTKFNDAIKIYYSYHQFINNMFKCGIKKIRRKLRCTKK